MAKFSLYTEETVKRWEDIFLIHPTIIGGTKKMSFKNLILKDSVQNITPGLTITPNLAVAQSFVVEGLNTNTTILAPVNLPAEEGMVISLCIKQNATGGFTVAFNSAYSRSATAVGLAANAVTILTFRYVFGKWCEQSISVIS